MGYPSLGGSFIDLALQFRATQFTAAAVITLWAYDYLLTFLDEIELVWRGRRFSWTKILFCISVQQSGLRLPSIEPVPSYSTVFLRRKA
ncbi:hypothetical protein FRC19_003150 [Serendipita sp. 401]|nr:hypothetical protein FRC19_003150 [Serendipita sp. 401]KAG9041641.1 hypothetical protein FS842_002477 [Serendipita sp. 407]